MKEIKELTKEDLLSNDGVLLEVFEQEDEIYRTHMLIALREQASVLRCKGDFDKLVAVYEKSYREFKENNSKIAPQGDGHTHFSDSSYSNMRCGSWIADDKGIKMYVHKKGEIEVFSHPILPVQLLKNINTGYVKVKIAYKLRGKWEEILISKDEVCSSNKILALAKYGIGVTSENARTLVQYLSEIESYNEDVIDMQLSTNKLGWINKEFMPYCTSVIFDNASQFREAFESINAFGEKATWYDLVKEIRQYNKLSLNIYLAASLASVLVDPLNALPFIVSLWGESGKGKTVALMLAASVWANPGEKAGYLTDPKSTPTALELRLDFLNNLPMMIDDMAQVKERYHGNFSELVYYLCSGKGKDRANASLGLNKSTTWRNCILTNGEHSLVTETMQGGAVNRIIDVEMEDGYLFPDGNKVAETLKENYGFAGQEFIKVIKNLGFDKIREIQQDFAQKIRDIAKASNIEKEQKQILPMSIILTADKLATEYIFKDDIYLNLQTCIDTLKSVGEVSENERAYEFIMSEVSVHMNNFKPDVMSIYHGECWGKIEDNYVYIYTNVFTNMCDRGNFSRKSFLKWADKEELLISETGRFTKQKKINATNSKCICLKCDNEESKNCKKEEFVQVNLDDLPFNE